jgi:hypothetical protein
MKGKSVLNLSSSLWVFVATYQPMGDGEEISCELFLLSGLNFSSYLWVFFLATFQPVGKEGDASFELFFIKEKNREFTIVHSSSRNKFNPTFFKFFSLEHLKLSQSSVNNFPKYCSERLLSKKGSTL